MADVELIIKIPEEMYEIIQDSTKYIDEVARVCEDAVSVGTPLPKGHGDLIDRNLALSGDGLCEFHMYDDYVKMRNYLKSIPPIIRADKTERKEEG